jgi:hypothetical protein
MLLARVNSPRWLKYMRFPDFYIVGAARAGTTSLWQYLNQHPLIFMPSDVVYKEPAYFADLYGIKSLEKYLSLFTEANPEQIIGEASTAYLAAPESPRRLYSATPHAKIIISLRNPSERAYSLYNWMAKEGYEWINTFELALMEETKREKADSFRNYNPENYYNYLYYQSGLYSDQIARYQELFAQENIHFINFDSFVKNPLKETQRVYRFLCVDSDFHPVIRVHNPSVSVYSARLQFAIRQLFQNRINLIPQVVRMPVMQFLLNLNSNSLPPKPIGKETRRLLDELYAADVRRTSEITGLDLSAWSDPIPIEAGKP